MVTSQSLYLLLLGALAAERLSELALSRRNARRTLARGGIEFGRRHFRVMSLVHVLFLPACAVEVLLIGRAFPGWLGWSALALVACAQALRYWAVASLGDRWNVRVLVVPEEPPVTTGPYRFVRHPNYVAVAAEMLLVPLVHGAWVTALVFSAANAALLVVRIRVEERALGATHADLFARRPRLVPRWRRA